MPLIEGLRCVRLGLKDPAAACDYVSRVLGLERIAAPDGLAMFRSDYRDHTLVIVPGADEILALELRDLETLESLTAKLVAAGYNVSAGDATACAQRRCKAFVSFQVRKGHRIELVVRPQNSGWRFHGARDSGIVGFHGVAFATTDITADIRLWTVLLGGKVSDYLGEAAYIKLDDQHHRIALHPSNRDGILEVQYAVESMDQLMQNRYFLESLQVPIVHGPGRRPASEQLFLTFKGPGSQLFGFVSEGSNRPFSADILPRQFPRNQNSYCAWGSQSTVPEFAES